MPDAIAETAFGVCELWLNRCLTGLEACPGLAPITDSYVAAGAIAWDSCCGLLVAAPERIYRTADFPIEGTTDYVCESSFLTVDVLVLLLRCVPVIDDRGKAPASAVMNEAYRAVIQDAAIIWNEMVGELPEGWSRANVDQAFVGAAGGCVGVETRMTIGLGQSYWCPPCLNPLGSG